MLCSETLGGDRLGLLYSFILKVLCCWLRLFFVLFWHSETERVIAEFFTALGLPSEIVAPAGQIKPDIAESRL